MASSLKSISDAKLKDAAGLFRQYLSVNYLKSLFNKSMDSYRVKYIDTGSDMPFWHFIYGGTILSYILVWPTEYGHYKHKEEARLRGENH